MACQSGLATDAPFVSIMILIIMGVASRLRVATPIGAFQEPRSTPADGDRLRGELDCLEFITAAGESQCREGALHIVRAPKFVHGPRISTQPGLPPLTVFQEYGGKSQSSTEGMYPCSGNTVCSDRMHEMDAGYDSIARCSNRKKGDGNLPVQ